MEKDTYLKDFESGRSQRLTQKSRPNAKKCEMWINENASLDFFALEENIINEPSKDAKYNSKSDYPQNPIENLHNGTRSHFFFFAFIFLFIPRNENIIPTQEGNRE